MKVGLSLHKAVERMRTPALAVGVFSEGEQMPITMRLDQASAGAMMAQVGEEFRAEAGKMQVLHYVPGVDAERVVLLGLGKREACDSVVLTRANGVFVRYCREAGLSAGVSTLLAFDAKPNEMLDRARMAAQVVLHEVYRYHAVPKKSHNVEAAIQLQACSFWLPSDNRHARQGLREGVALGQGVNFARQQADLPPNICTPSYLGKVAQDLAKDFSCVKVKVMRQSQIERLGMGAFLAVAKGSSEPPAFIVMHYSPVGKQSVHKPVVLIGKGVTFDSGGLSLKSAGSMEEMKYDMGGAAAVLGVMRAVAELELPYPVIALIPTCENMPSGTSMRPGDVLSSMSGQTIEVLNTDAEGRLILCDALTYAERFDPAAVIDVATLTGACVVTLGHVHSGLFGSDQNLVDQLRQAGLKVQDTVWQLPLEESYQNQLDSPFADMTNVGGRPAGAITAACFLSRFSSAYPWAHLDIAGTARHRGANRRATGRPVPLLVQYLLDRA